MHRRLLRMAKRCEAIRFLKISTAYAHTAGYQFYAVYYQGDEISPEDQAVIDALNAFPKDDPVAFYDECMKHVPSEEYTVDRQGNRTGSYWNTTHPLGKGITDFLIPETYCKMNRFETNTYEWERYSSDMEDDDDFGNVYEMIERLKTEKRPSEKAPLLWAAPCRAACALCEIPIQEGDDLSAGAGLIRRERGGDRSDHPAVHRGWFRCAQPSAELGCGSGIDAKHLKQAYGKDITFWSSSIDTQ